MILYFIISQNISIHYLCVSNPMTDKVQEIEGLCFEWWQSERVARGVSLRPRVQELRRPLQETRVQVKHHRIHRPSGNNSKSKTRNPDDGHPMHKSCFCHPLNCGRVFNPLNYFSIHFMFRFFNVNSLNVNSLG